MFVKQVTLSFVLNILQCYGNFVAPDVTLEAFEPQGFRASIPALKGIQMFGFHGNLNKEISTIDPGQFSQDFISPTDSNVWSYLNKELKLKIGDIIHYWVFIQYEKLGYLKKPETWNVTELLELTQASCETSSSQVVRKSFVCKNSTIFEENFSSPTINQDNWLIEEYIPYNSVDYEFVSYQNDPNVCYIKNNRLFIKPKSAQNDYEVRGELDLRTRCTRRSADECYFQQESAFILPPVTSARLVSKLHFRYGKIEIKAKLPSGDWIYPQMYLEQVTQPNKKLWIAYARGNKQLLAHSNEDIGGSLLFGGLVLQPIEPYRSTYLKTLRDSVPFSNQMHIYTVHWNKDHISLEVDGSSYGKIDTTVLQEKFSDTDMVRLVLGIGVGGVNDFPDDFRSGNDIKPWHNKERTQVKNFFTARDKWLKTWSGDNSALQIEYIKILAL